MFLPKTHKNKVGELHLDETLSQHYLFFSLMFQKPRPSQSQAQGYSKKKKIEGSWRLHKHLA